LKIIPKIGIAFTSIVGFDLDQDKLENFKVKFAKTVDKLELDKVFIDFTVTGNNTAKKANEIFKRESVDLIMLVVAVWTPDLIALSIIENLDIPVIIFTTSLTPHTVSVNGAQVIASAFTELGIDFKFIFGEIEDIKVKKKIMDYSIASAIIARLKKFRIGLIGHVPEIMISLNVDFFAVKKYFGPTVIPIDTYTLENYVSKIIGEDKDKIDVRAEDIRRLVGKVIVEGKDLNESIAYYFALKNIALDFDLDALAINCFPVPGLKGKTCLAVSNLNDEGLIAACEGDVNSAIIMSIFNLITGKACLNSDFIIEDKKDNTIMFSHCGGGPFSCAAKFSDIIIDRHYEVKSGLGVYYPVKIDNQDATVVNLIGNGPTYRLCVLNGKTIATDKLIYHGNPVNIKFKTDIEELINTIGNKGFGHHWMVSYGNHHDIFLEISKLLGVYCLTVD
jgi:L-fucose isomerase-like protein